MFQKGSYDFEYQLATYADTELTAEIENQSTGKDEAGNEQFSPESTTTPLNRR